MKGLGYTAREWCDGGMESMKVPLPWTSTPTPPTPKRPEGGSNVTKSLRNAVRLIDQAESTAQNEERSRPGVSEDEKANELEEILTSVSS
jgi:hypothetical protein